MDWVVIVIAHGGTIGHSESPVPRITTHRFATENAARKAAEWICRGRGVTDVITKAIHDPMIKPD